MTDYDISFNESVKGLSVNNDVLFSGIRVGKVTQITISRTTPGEVRVRVSIAADTPVRENSFAQLELRGITGISVIAISGGTAESSLLQAPEDGVASIRYEPSPLASVVARMPDVLASASQVLQRLDTLLSGENIQRVSNILASFEKVSAALGDRSETIGRVVTQSEELARHLDQVLITANETLVTDAGAASRSLNSIAKRVDGALAVMEPGLKQFSTQGLSDMRMLMVEMRNMVHILTRVGQKLESDPRRFLFGETVTEYQNR
jgi:phospholipid/cholesterol/gamma-HCH transport system substrate-binding protein